jgi:hypothetical protein
MNLAARCLRLWVSGGESFDCADEAIADVENCAIRVCLLRECSLDRQARIFNKSCMVLLQ